MDRLDALSPAEGGPGVWVGTIAEDVTSPNDETFVVLPDYDASQQFGPVKFVPQLLMDGTALLPSRGDWCLVAFDQDDNAQMLFWRADDPTVT